MGRLLSRLRQYTRGQRNKRFRAFLDELRPAESGRLIKVLDLGGTVPFWQAWNITAHDKLHLTLVNDHISDAENDVESETPFIANRRSDVLTLTKDDFRSFDLIFSNSMIEHLSSWHAQRELADRIGSSEVPYFVQIPNKYAPIDPHIPRLYLPFFGAYPKPVQAQIITFKSFGPDGRKPASLAEAYESFLNHYNPLGVRDVRELFPDAKVEFERAFGAPMSILACRLSPPSRSGG
jgi:hypothetical protein